LRKDRLPVDWPKTYAMWSKQYPGLTWGEIKKTLGKKKVVYNLNAHTDGYRFKFYWFRGKCKVVNNTAYGMRLYRPHLKYLAERAFEPENGIDFREIDFSKYKKRRKHRSMA